MITYNHEKYIAEAIESVLNQTFTDFEFIIVNDGSTDKTDEIIKSYQDSRIVYIYQDNQGPSAALNNGILTARGKYIALFSGDDVCYPHRLEKQYDYLETTGNKIVFAWADFIDDDSQILIGEHFAKSFFNHSNRSQAEMLHWFFMRGNYLCAVTAFLEKEILLAAGLFNLTSIQIQDFDLWLKLIKKSEISILEVPLVKYRIRSGEINLSGNPANYCRSLLEGHLINKDIVNDVDINLFKTAFGSYIKKADFQEGIEYDLEKAFLYLSHPSALTRSIGYEKLFYLLQDKSILSVAKCEYDFGLPELYELAKDIDITNMRLLQKNQAALEELQSQLQLTHKQFEELHKQFEELQVHLQYSQSQLQHFQSQLQNTQDELQQSQSQLQNTQDELQQSQSQLQNTKNELQQSQSQLQNTQNELQQSQSQLQQTQRESQQYQLQLQQTSAQLEQTQLQLQQTQNEFQDSQLHLRHTQVELERLQLENQQTKVELNRSQERITAMESSKFWKLRKAWFNLKTVVGIKTDE
jgi:glycosyltransferase involved in cell wall biosynthesis/peptidoglycan hydrolase CwlO-like protein